MPEFYTNGNSEAYLAQLFNPGGGQFNPGVYSAIGNPGIGAGWGGIGAGQSGATPGFGSFAGTQQNPLTGQGFGQANGLWPQQQQAYNPVQSLVAIQLAQQIVTKQAIQAVQVAQALQTLLQLTHYQVAQQAQQGQFGLGLGGVSSTGQIGQPFPQIGGMGVHGLVNPAVHQQTLQQLVQYLAMQQPGQFRYGMTV